MIATGRILAGVWMAAAFFGVSGVSAQPTPESLDSLFHRLEQIQDANLGVARRMADTQRLAADELQQVLDEGLITSSAHQAIARTLIANARTLAAIMLSPMQTYQTAAGDSMFALVERNSDMVGEVARYGEQSADFATAISRYTILQIQTQDLAEALQNGWERYADVMLEAERSGLLAPRAFDRETQSWSIGSPVLSTNIAGVTELPVPPDPEPEPEEVAVASPPAGSGVLSILEPPMNAVAPAERPAVTPGDERLTAEPSETETLSADAAPLEVPALPTPEAVPVAEGERLSPGGPLEVARVEPANHQYGDWAFTRFASGGAAANSPNLVFETNAVIQSLAMTCAPDGSVQYVVNAGRTFPAYRVYSDRSNHMAVDASANVIRGEAAGAMADALRRAYDWAQQVPDAGRRLTLRTADTEGILALFATGGYLEARRAVVTACGADEDEEAVTAEAGPEGAAPTLDETAASEEPGAATEVAEVPVTQPERPAVRSSAPPIPMPRSARPEPNVLPVDSSVPTGPINLLGGG